MESVLAYQMVHIHVSLRSTRDQNEQNGNPVPLFVETLVQKSSYPEVYDYVESCSFVKTLVYVQSSVPFFFH